MPISKYVKGDVRDTPYRYIAHGVNCQNVMGSGVAKALYEKWESVKICYHDYMGHKILTYDMKPRDFLGLIQTVIVDIETKKTVFNCFTQEDYGFKKGQRLVNYWAIAECFKELNEFIKHEAVQVLAIPKIGSGLACGDWNIIKEIINDATPDIEVVVYEY